MPGSDSMAIELGLALGLGLLVGLQRERAASRIAGIRTFPLVSVLGTLCAAVGERFPWLPAAGLLSLAALLAVTHYFRQAGPDPDPGLTTEAAMLVMYGVGACLAAGLTTAAVAVGGGVAVLLHLKPEMHRLAGRIDDRDFRAVMQFVLITLVILPVLPNRAFGPYGVWNPFKIWLLVVLIVGISLAGYAAHKGLGARQGLWVSGVLGGLISSTAATVSYARRAKVRPEAAAAAAPVIATASTVLLVRLALILAAVNPALLLAAARPLAALFFPLAGLTLWLWRRGARWEGEDLTPANPTELKPALFFAALFALILWAVAAAQARLGAGGVYAVSAVSGLTDVDAITLSAAEMFGKGRIAADIGWRAILVAAAANALFKWAVCGAMGGRRLFFKMGVYFGVYALLAGALAAAW